MRLERGSKEPLFHVSGAPSDLSFRPRQDDSRSESSCGNGTCFSVQEGLFEPSPRSVILSEVVVREADDNAVEGPRVFFRRATASQGAALAVATTPVILPSGITNHKRMWKSGHSWPRKIAGLNAASISSTGPKGQTAIPP